MKVSVEPIDITSLKITKSVSGEDTKDGKRGPEGRIGMLTSDP
jgi:CRISPR/Cas system type I-B associated protein Csh2 (Cas7 group RAMP superfamily)